LKIAIDASCLAVNRFSGLGEFAHNLLLHMPGISADNHISLFINYFRNAGHIQEIYYPGTVNHFLKAPRKFVEFLWSFNWLPFDLYLKDVDIFHSIHINVPPAKKMKTILTVHDCRYLAYPNLYKKREVEDYRRKMKRSLDRVDFVVTISEFTRQEVLNYFSFPEERIKIIHYGFTPLRVMSGGYSRLEKAVIGKKITQPYLLFPSSLDPRKNLGRLIEALAKCKNENSAFPQLVVVGIPPDYWCVSDQAAQAKKLGVLENILMCGIVNRDIITELINNAHALCYPSLYEGFGIPPLEAMSLGIPVLAGKSSSIPEIVGPAACLVDPLSVDEIVHGLNKIVFDSEYRRKLIALGYQQVSRYSWPKAAAEYIDLYKWVMNQ
jgi:glycosyltransferase involved in cell wall biosynthesis